MQTNTEDLLLQLADVSARLEQLHKLVDLPIAKDAAISEGLHSTIAHWEAEKRRIEQLLGTLSGSANG